ncbi:MAG: NupC/NupG family nucleoside CNT transporter [Verrucomicrobiales bacterium]
MPLPLISLLGVIAFLGLAWIFSEDRKRISWRLVAWGLGLQLFFAWLILKTPVGLAFFNIAQQAVLRLNESATEGMKMVLGPLASSDLLSQSWGPHNSFILAISVTGMIILVSSLSSLLYHFGILQKVVQAMGWFMQKTMGASGSESLAAAANIFMGQTEAPLLVKPYIPRMTRSELLCLMVGGMASIAGGVLAVYVSLGASSGHLVTASVMSAPAAIMMAKILLPEKELSETAGTTPVKMEITSVNSIDALVRGASEGLQLSLNVLAMLIAFAAVIYLANFLLGLVLQPFGVAITLQAIAGYLNAPFAWIMGVPARDCLLVGQMLGERIVLNEFVAYLTLTKNQSNLDSRSVILASYALCGFANFGSIAIQIGGIGALAPERRNDLVKLGLKSMFGGLLACYLTAAIAGVMVW